jgi:hypothetical protein
MASAIKSILFVVPTQSLLAVERIAQPQLFGFIEPQIVLARLHMHVVWFCIAIIAAAFLSLIVFAWRDVRKQERIAKDHEDHGW